MDRSELKAIVAGEIDNMRGEMVEMSNRIHAHPELRFEEHQAARWLTEWLEKHGFQVERGIAELPTSFRATRVGRSTGPTIALLAEYDALPMGHACGHNIIATASTAAGIALGKVADRLSGKIIVLGTPGEESGGGKILMLERGAFDGVDAAMMVHPTNRTKLSSKFLATTRIEVEFVGKASHAGAAPHKGINALDALVASYVNIGLLRQHIRSDARIHGIITKGGDAVNIVPAIATATFQIRAADNEYLDELYEKVLGCFKAGAQATGASVSFRQAGLRYSVFRSNRTMEQAFGENLAALNITLSPQEGIEEGTSTDVGNVSQLLPTIHPTLAITDGPSPHTAEFLDAAVSERGHLGMLNAAKALAFTSIDLMTDTGLLAMVKAEFARH